MFIASSGRRVFVSVAGMHRSAVLSCRLRGSKRADLAVLRIPWLRGSKRADLAVLRIPWLRGSRHTGLASVFGLKHDPGQLC